MKALDVRGRPIGRRALNGRYPRTAGKVGLPAIVRFEAKVQKSDGCWEWTGARSEVTGYGLFWVGGRLVSAHRFAWTHFRGEIADCLWVLHSCDNRPCVNPDRLFLGTHAENMADMVAKGRGPHRPMKLTVAEVGEIRASDEPQRVLANRYGISRSYVGSIRSRKVWARF